MVMAPHEHSEQGKVEFDGRPSVVERPHPLSVVYGGGGVFGIAYGAGVAHGLSKGGIDVATAPALGTSAGAWAASAVALGMGYEHFADMESPSVPTRRPILAEAAREIFGPPATTWWPRPQCASRPGAATSSMVACTTSPTWWPRRRPFRVCSLPIASTAGSTSTVACGP